jgi:PAS domain-containing protein
MLTPVRSHAGGLLGAIVLVRDATRARRGSRERTRLVQLARQAASTAVAAQRSLELAERKFAAFMSELPFPAYILGENGDMIFENDAGRRLAGWREALACARTADDGECAFEIPGDARRYVDVRFPIHANGRVWTGGLAIDVTTRGARTESDAA